MSSKANWDALMDYVEFPVKCRDSDCPYLITCRDGFGTGDSPTAYECSASKIERCPHIDDYIDSLTEGEDNV